MAFIPVLARIPLFVCLAAALMSGGRAVAADGEGPSFSCARAQGAAETLVCRDPVLARLDRTLSAIYGEALALSRSLPDGGEDLRSLKAVQRGWVKGRDDCWKSEDLRSCVESAYQGRIGTLIALYRLRPSGGAVFYMCNGHPADEIAAEFFAAPSAEANGSVRLERGDRVVAGVQVRSGSGALYEAESGISIWLKGDEARLEWPEGVVSQCRVKGA